MTFRTKEIRTNSVVLALAILALMLKFFMNEEGLIAFII